MAQTISPERGARSAGLQLDIFAAFDLFKIPEQAAYHATENARGVSISSHQTMRQRVCQESSHARGESQLRPPAQEFAAKWATAALT